MGRVWGSFWERFGRDLEALGQFFDVIFDEVTTHLKLRFSSIEKKDPKRGFGGVWRGLGRILESFWGRLGASLEGIWGRFGAFQVGNQFH